MSIGSFLYHTRKSGIIVEKVQFILKLLLEQIFCCTPRFPLILTTKFHSLDVKESVSGVGNFAKVGVGVGYFTSGCAILIKMTE